MIKNEKGLNYVPKLTTRERLMHISKTFYKEFGIDGLKSDYFYTKVLHCNLQLEHPLSKMSIRRHLEWIETAVESIHGKNLINDKTKEVKITITIS